MIFVQSLCRRCSPSARAGFVVPLLAFICSATLFTQSARSQPNIVFIVTDDAGFSDFGFNAAAHGTTTDVRTPNLDALAGQSVLMTSAYVSGPVCSPSRAGFLTGRYQQRIGYEDNPGTADGLPAGEQLVSHHLQDLGYTTSAIGKWHLGQTDNVNRPLDMGFDEFYGFFGGGRPFWEMDSADRSRRMTRGNANIESQWSQEGDQSRYDPVNGRYVTDALGEEAASFINRHASDNNPFFLYVSLNGPHTPLQAKQSDLNEFIDIADSGRRTVAAMMYSVDRAVGDITTALSANGIDDNTIVVFLNDNGGPASSVGPYNNTPFYGNKGSLWEGGIRVPMMIKAPGLAAGTYDEATVSRDLAPTLINAAGGDAGDIDLDGTDLMPFLSGEVGDDPHELMFWRHIGGRFAIRKGDWKLVRPGSAIQARLHNVATDVHEDVAYNTQHPEVVTELLRELTFWEATLEKPKWGPLGEARNRFDHFVFRNSVAPTASWSNASVWKQGGAETIVSFVDEDSYANAVLEFTVRNDSNYTSTNNMKRMTAQTFMLNQVRLTGNFSGTSNHSGTINGNALLFVKNLDGLAPRVQLDATSNQTTRGFKFALDNELQLLDHLEFTGNGTQEFVIGGDIRDFHEPRAVVKSGTSGVTLSGNNSFGGGLLIQSGHVTTSNILGPVANIGGIFAPGPAQGLATTGAFLQNMGVLEIELGGTVRGSQYDALRVNGDFHLGGTLQLTLVNGFVPQADQSFSIIDWTGELSGSFSNIELPALADHLDWNTAELYTRGLLSVVFTELPGDVNLDNANNAADYVAWRKLKSADIWRPYYGNTGGSGSAPGDLNHDKSVDAADYVIWRKTNGDFDDWQQFFGAAISANDGVDGDFNGDGNVDAADYVALRKSGIERDYFFWREHFAVSGDTGAISDSDFNHDGVISAADYVVWRKNLGTTQEYNAWRELFGHLVNVSSGSSEFSVPEPTGLSPVVSALLLTLAMGRIHRRWFHQTSEIPSDFR